MATRRRSTSRGTHGDVFLHHQMRIARQTLKYSDIGARIMGGMTKDEARELIRRHGGGESEIRRLEQNPHSDLAQEAFVAGREWYRSGQHSSGVANARVVRYGFLQWWNELSPQKTQGHSKAKVGKLERAFREGWGRAKSGPSPNPGGTRYRGVISAIPGHLLRGGKKKVVSSWFSSKKEAHDWVYAMEQPGIETHHIERGAPGGRRTSKNPGGPLDTHAATELENYITSDSGLYSSQHKPIQKNLITKMARGVYNHEKAVKLFGYLAESGAKKYIREFGSPGDKWNEMFSPATRKSTAEELTRFFETEAKLGNYDSYLPKKYSDWRLKKNPGRMCDVLVRRNGQTFKAKAKYDVGAKRVRIFVNPKVAEKMNPHISGRDLSVGGVQKKILGNGVEVSLWKEHGTYHVRAHDFNEHKRLDWKSFPTMSAARVAFGKMVRQYK